MVLVAPFGSPLGYSINIFLGLVLSNSFCTWKVFFVGVLIGTLSDFIIDAVEGYLVGLSLGLPLRSPLEYINPGSDLPGMLMVAPLGVVVWL